MSKRFDLLIFGCMALFLFGYEFFIYQPYLLYTQFQPAFYFDVHFLNSFLDYPGGIGELFSLFIFQFFSYKIVAAVVTSLFLLGIAILSIAIFKKLFAQQAPLFYQLIPLLLMVIFYSAYNSPLALIIKFVLILLLAYFYTFENNLVRIVLLLLLPLIYYITGGWYCLVFVTLVFSIHILSRWRLMTLFWPLLFAGFYFITAFLSARFLFIISLNEAFFYTVPFKYSHAPYYFKADFWFYAMSFALPVLLIIWRGVEIIIRRILHNQQRQNSKWLVPVNFFVAVLMFLIVIFVTSKPDEKRKNFINYLAEKGEWKQVLVESKKMHDYDRIVEFQTNRALYFTGCLLDSLFYIDHPIGINGLFIDRIMSSQIAMPASDLYFDLGHINAAQVMAYEYQTKFRYDPRVLKRLALTNAINGHFSKAEKFLTLLNKSLIHKAWVKENSALFQESTAANMALVAEKRQWLPKMDFFLHSQEPNSDLVGLIESNNKNKMAMEYLMACYLLDCKIGNIVNYIPSLAQFGYKQVPLHIEEAAIMYQTGAKQSGLELIKDMPFHRDLVMKFAGFNKIMAAYQTNEQRKAQLLREGYKTTFWFYLFDGGRSRKDSLKKRKLEGGY